MLRYASSSGGPFGTESGDLRARMDGGRQETVPWSGREACEGHDADRYRATPLRKDTSSSSRGMQCIAFQPTWTQKHVPGETEYRLKPNTVIDLRADLDLLPSSRPVSGSPSPDEGCPLQLRKMLARPRLQDVSWENRIPRGRYVAAETNNPEEGIDQDFEAPPPVTDPYWETGCRLLDKVDEPASETAMEHCEFPQPELMQKSILYLRSALHAHWKDVIHGVTLEGHRTRSHDEDNPEHYAAAIVRDQWALRVPGPVTKHIVSLCERRVARYMKCAMNAWRAWQQWQFERPL